jgi:hypothetical protein
MKSCSSDISDFIPGSSEKKAVCRFERNKSVIWSSKGGRRKVERGRLLSNGKTATLVYVLHYLNKGDKVLLINNSSIK